jgi:hypothetical protein
MTDLSTTWQDLARLPQLLGEVRTGVLALKSLVNTPAAALATGSPAAGLAIGVLGAQLVHFIAETIEAIDQDTEGVQQVARNYRANEDSLTGQANAGAAAVDALGGAQRPSIGDGPGCTARRAMQVASQLDDYAVPIAGAVRTAGDTAQSVLGAGEWAVRTVGSAVADVVDDVPFVGRDVAGAVRGVSDGAGDALRGVSDAVEGVEDAAADVADGARRVSGRADDMLSLAGNCEPVGAGQGAGR